MLTSPLPAGLRFSDPAVLIATGLGPGLLRPAPGTWGSLAAVIVGYGLLQWGGWTVLFAAICLATALGIWAADKIEQQTGEHDHGFIVIDEYAGQWLALLPAPHDPLYAVAAFALFRLFDVWKPGPIGWLDRHAGGGWGVMADDLLAGLLAAALLCTARWMVGGFT